MSAACIAVPCCPCYLLDLKPAPATHCSDEAKNKEKTLRNFFQSVEVALRGTAPWSASGRLEVRLYWKPAHCIVKDM